MRIALAAQCGEHCDADRVQALGLVDSDREGHDRGHSGQGEGFVVGQLACRNGTVH